MTDVASRELRNNTRSLLDRVEAGEDIRITVDGRPVAILASVGSRPRFVSKERFASMVVGHQADAGLRHLLGDLLPDLTDDPR